MSKPETLLTENLFELSTQIYATRIEDELIQVVADHHGRNSDTFVSLGYAHRQAALDLARKATLEEAQHWIDEARRELLHKPSRWQRLLSVFQ